MSAKLILGDWLITTAQEAPKPGWGVRVVGETIAAVGPHPDLRRSFPEDPVHDATGYVIAPGFVKFFNNL